MYEPKIMTFDEAMAFATDYQLAGLIDLPESPTASDLEFALDVWNVKVVG